MHRSKQALMVLTLALLGAWGCSQSSTPGPSATDRLKALEMKNSKLEDDFRAMAAARDQLRRKLAAAEEQQQELQRQLEALQAVRSERDELRSQLSACATERDNLLIQFDQFRRSLRDLLGQAEAALARPADPVTTAVDVEVETPGKS